jgi:uncharacterized protein YpiB (UPF0302 family)
MFDEFYPLKAYFEELKKQKKQDILNMIDLALDTKDIAWWNELHERLEGVN